MKDFIKISIAILMLLLVSCKEEQQIELKFNGRVNASNGGWEPEYWAVFIENGSNENVRIGMKAVTFYGRQSENQVDITFEMIGSSTKVPFFITNEEQLNEMHLHYLKKDRSDAKGYWIELDDSEFHFEISFIREFEGLKYVTGDFLGHVCAHNGNWVPRCLEIQGFFEDVRFFDSEASFNAFYYEKLNELN